MQLGPYHLQILGCAVLILAAAVVALLVDFLKGNNEQLRELAIELRTKRDEVAKRSQTMKVPQPVAAVAVGSQMQGAVSDQTQVPTAQRTVLAVSETVPAAHAAPAPIRSRHLAARDITKRNVAPAALAAMERGARRAANPQQRENVQPAVHTVKPSAPPAPAVFASAPVVQNTVSEPNTGRKNWGAILSRPVKGMPPVTVVEVQPMAEQTYVAQNDMSAALAASETSLSSTQVVDPALPAGFHDGFVLTRLVQSRQPITGLVVSIGVYATRSPHG
jgi:hypothetical protein